MIGTADGVAEQWSASRFAVVGIGTSAGGVAATKRFFESTSGNSGMAYVVVLHLSEDHESHLAQILQAVTTMPVVQVNQTTTVQPNHVYVIPPAKHILLDDGQLRLIEPEHVRGKRVPIDLFFRSLAETYGKNAVAVVLTGTGSDGTLGLERVKEMGGFTVVQDPEEAEYDGMPRSAIASGLIDFVLPLAEIPEKLRRVINLVEPLEVSADSGAQDDEGSGGGSLREVLSLVQIRTGHDFSNYKRPTLRRRIARRLQVHELTDLGEYVDLLRSQPNEVDDLLRDLLITVTNFFRDPEAFAGLESEVIPKLFEDKTAQDTVRVWVAGCGTGEEAYSVGILLLEYAQTLVDPPRIQIFASDINAQAIRIGRECKYDEAISVDVSPERLERFFTKESNLYRVKKELRELVLFAPHNLLRDPPFSKLDLVTCRNLLIYLNRPTQQRVIELFHFSLNRGGYLFLGSSESIDSSAALFEILDKKKRLYRARNASLGSHQQVPPAMPAGGKWLPERWLTEGAAGSVGKSLNHGQPTSFSDLHDQLKEQLATPSVLIDAQYEILHASEGAARFLRFTAGEPTHNLLKALLPDLVLDLRATLMMATREGRRVEARHVRFELDGVERSVNIDVRPEREDGSGLILVMLEEQPVRSAPDGQPSVSETLRSDRAIESVVQRLEDESQAIRERLKSTVEQFKISTEELKASNEELQAINEELRSASEELETSKEELQSLNEELITVNHELKDNVDEVGRVNSDLQNLMASTNIATIFLDRALNIKRFTPPVKEIFNLIPTDVGRPLAHVTHHLEYNGLIEDASAVLTTLHSQEHEITSLEKQRDFLVRLSPYRTNDDRIDGVVLSFVDITSMKRAEASLRDADQRKNEFLATLSHELRNPLNALRSSLTLMERLNSVADLQAERENALQPLEMMRRLIDDLLDVGRVSQGKVRLRLAATPLSGILERCVQMLSARISESGLTFHLELPPASVMVSGDAVRLEQVFVNLLSNAIKYSNPGGQVWLTVEVSNQRAQVKVRDSGIGLPSDRLESVFELFSQVTHDGLRTQDGLGIGLYLVKQIIELHGGTVAAISDGPGHGSQFTASLPLIADAGQTPAPLESAPAAGAAKSWRILLSDDYESARKAVARLLRYMGHEIATAADGPETLKVAATFKPELILLDINMPGMNGYEVAKALRSQPAHAETVLIALTGYGQPEDIRRALDAGFNGHIVKPLDPDALEKMLLERSWASAVIAAD